MSSTSESPRRIEILAGSAGLGAIVEYHDELVPGVNLGDDEFIYSTPDPAERSYDAVIIHVVHPGTSLDWLVGQRVIDPSGRLRGWTRAKPTSRCSIR